MNNASDDVEALAEWVQGNAASAVLGNQLYFDAAALLRTIPALWAEIKTLKEALLECADGLEAEVHNHLVSKLEQEMNGIALALTPKPKAHVTVSDHAVLRYLERKYSLNIPEIKSEILTPQRAAMIEAGATEISVDNMRFKVQGNTIVTAI